MTLAELKKIIEYIPEEQDEELIVVFKGVTSVTGTRTILSVRTDDNYFILQEEENK